MSDQHETPLLIWQGRFCMRGVQPFIKVHSRILPLREMGNGFIVGKIIMKHSPRIKDFLRQNLCLCGSERGIMLLLLIAERRKGTRRE